MKRLALVFAGVFLFSGCIQLNLPEAAGNQTVQYTLVLPDSFKAPEKKISVSEFLTESPARFKMLSRKGTALQYDTFSKWSQTPSVMLTSAFRKLYKDDDQTDTAYTLEGDIYTFERNLDNRTADLKVLYRLVSRTDRKVIFSTVLNTSVPLKGDTPADFAEAMSRAVVEQAEKIKQETAKVK